MDAGQEPWLADGEDPVLGYLSEVLTALGGVSAGMGRIDDAARVDRISMLEKIKAAAAAAQAAEIVCVRPVAGRRSSVRYGVNYRRLGQGIAEQVGLATHTGGWQGARKLTLARDLITELPQIFDLLTRGEISEYVAQLVATETSHLDAETRRRVDHSWRLWAGGVGAEGCRRFGAEAGLCR